MKKLLILAATAIGTLGLASCGAGSARITSDTDSLAYAIGVDVATNIFRYDSTLNSNILAKAFKDVFAGKATMTAQEAQAYVQEYMAVILPRKNKAEGLKFVEEAVAAGATKTESGMAYKIEKEGTGVKAQVGDSVVVNYTLSFPNGRKIQSTDGKTVTFLLQDGALIPAWIEGMQMLNPGSKATFFVPADLAYGVFGMEGSPIGPNQALKFEVELERVIDAPDTATETPAAR